MKAALFYAPGDVRIEDVPVPEPGPGEDRVRVERSLTCGTDVKTYRRGHPRLLKRLPSPFGHEFAGVIDAIGPGALTRIADARIDPRPFISGEMGLDQLVEALERHGRQEGIKFAIRP